MEDAYVNKCDVVLEDFSRSVFPPANAGLF